MSAPITRRGLFRLEFAGRRAADRWLRVHRVAMACRFEVTLDGSDAARVGAAREALDEADRVETLLTVFRDSSEVSRVNREAAESAVAVDAELFALLERCAGLSELTGGAFDITSTPLSRCWGFLRREGRLPAAEQIEDARALVGMSRLVLEANDRTVRFDRPGVELNFGAIGKGYALDRMARVLRRHGVQHALLSAGSSSVLAIGGRGRGWPIDLRSPQSARRRLARLSLRNGAVGTSGAGEQFFVVDGTRYGHVIDPRSGWPARGVLSASVIAASAADADGLSTACLIGGPALARQCCQARADTLALLTLDEEPERSWVAGRFDGAALEA